VKAILAIAVLVSAASVGQTFAQCTDAERKKLEDFDHAWSEATNRGDRAALQGIVADNFTGISPTGFTTKAELVDSAVKAAERAKASGRPAPKVTYDHYLIGCTPTSATLTHRTAVTETEKGKERTSYSRSVHVLEKRGDGWQVVSNAGHALTDSALLLYIEQDWNDAEMKQDTAWFDRTLADDYTGVNSRTGARTTKADDMADIKKNTVESATLSEMDVHMEGDTAVVTGVTHNKGKDEKGVASDRRIRFTDVWVKRDGKWLALSSHGTETK
jgi:ketosteroid isomerase-like protein